MQPFQNSTGEEIMSFKKISIENYIELHLKQNPTANKTEIKEKLEEALRDYQKEIKCACGNDIWVIGSAFIGNGCFTCITGDRMPEDDYEIDSAIKKRPNRSGQRHIDDMKPEEIHGIFDDDGYEINTNLIKKPTLCLSCVHDNDPDEDFLCHMTRFDQQDDPVFKCYAYQKIDT